jgi:hypothetical protein
MLSYEIKKVTTCPKRGDLYVGVVYQTNKFLWHSYKSKLGCITTTALSEDSDNYNLVNSIRNIKQFALHDNPRKLEKLLKSYCELRENLRRI